LSVGVERGDIMDNRAKIFLEKIAIFYKIAIDHKWVSELYDKIGEDVEIKSANTISVWISRGNIPDHAIKKLLKLNIPDELKKLYRKKKKQGMTIKQHEKTGLYLKNLYDSCIALQEYLSLYLPLKLYEKHINRIIYEINNVRSNLDDKVFEILPRGLELNKKVGVYYPGDEYEKRLVLLEKELNNIKRSMKYDRRKGERRKKDTKFDGDDCRLGERRRKIASGE